MWKPTYRVVLPEAGKGQALLQGWAVVDNTTGEDWRDVKLALTSGAPIAFRYDLHTPRDVVRTDLSAVGSTRRAQASIGEAGYAQPGAGAGAAPAADAPEPTMPSAQDRWNKTKDARAGRPMPAPATRMPPPPPKASRQAKADEEDRPYDLDGDLSGVDADELARSMQANTQAASVSGLSRYDLGERLTVPDGTSTMVAIINQQVEGEETFLFRPGGGGPGYEANPYRVIRFKNSTPFVLESGPISIYSGGSFVGEGISEPVSAGVAVTIPFAVESSFLVASRQQHSRRRYAARQDRARRDRGRELLAPDHDVGGQEPAAARRATPRSRAPPEARRQLRARAAPARHRGPARRVPDPDQARRQGRGGQAGGRRADAVALHAVDLGQPLDRAARGHPRAGQPRRRDPRRSSSRSSSCARRSAGSTPRSTARPAPGASSTSARRRPARTSRRSRRTRRPATCAGGCPIGSISSPRTATSSAAISSSCRPGAPRRRSRSRT